MIAPDSASGQVTASPRVRTYILYRSSGRKHSIGGVDWNPGVVRITAKTHIFLFFFDETRNPTHRPRRSTPGIPSPTLPNFKDDRILCANGTNTVAMPPQSPAEYTYIVRDVPWKVKHSAVYNLIIIIVDWFAAGDLQPRIADERE